MAQRLNGAVHSHGPTAPLVGRGSERVVLREELATAIAGRGRLILIGGEAGIGKTTLANDLAAEAAQRGALVLTGHCYDLTNTPPYGPWLDLFGTISPHEPSLPVPIAFAGGRLQASIVDQAALFAEVREVFLRLSETRPVLLVLEDLHWADPTSIELLRSLAAHLTHQALLIVGTYRVDELTRQHPLTRQLPALIRESDAVRLELKRLTAGDLRQLVAAQFALTPTDEARLIRYLGDHAEGNPFFATELLRALHETLVLQPAADGWTLGPLDQLVLPSLLRQVIDGRVDRLGEETRDHLAIAAIIGQEVALDLWSAAGDIDDEGLLSVVERAVAANLLQAERDGTRVRFVHALTREALYEGMLPPRRRAWHRRIAESLMVRPAADPDAVAAHLQRAGDPRAPEWMIQAGDRAQRAYALLTAVERFRCAADLLAGVAGEERTRSLLLYRLARLQRFSTPLAGIDDLNEAEILAHTAGDTFLAAEILYSRGLLRCYSDDFGGIAELEAGFDAIDALSEESMYTSGAAEVWLADSLPSNTDTMRGADDAPLPLSAGGMQHRRGAHPYIAAAGGHLDLAQEVGETFVRDLSPGQPLGSLLTSAAGHASLGLGFVSAARGLLDSSRAAFARARDYYRSLDHHALIAFSWLTELHDVVIPYFADDPQARHQAAVEAEAALRRAGGALVPGLSPRIAGLACLMLDGQWDDAEALVRESPPPGPCFLRRELTAAITTLARHRGESERAWESIASLLPDGPATLPGSKLHQETLFLQRLATDLALEAGDLVLARAWLEAHDRWLAWNGAWLGRADGYLVWARYHEAMGDRQQSQICAEEALAAASDPPQPLVLLAAHRHLGQLTGQAREETGALDHLRTAIALADACEVPFERAQSLLALAELHSHRRQVDEAMTLLADVRAVAMRLGARPLLAQAAALEQQLAERAPTRTHPFGLTAREADVLRLAAAGLTDATIAERLFISPRTVGQHLRAVYAKLDVGSRAAATRVAIEHNLV